MKVRFHQSHASNGGGALFQPTHNGHSVVMLSLLAHTPTNGKWVLNKLFF